MHPVVGELELLNANKVPHIVLIDDARLFLAPPRPHGRIRWTNQGNLPPCRLELSPKDGRVLQADAIFCR